MSPDEPKNVIVQKFGTNMTIEQKAYVKLKNFMYDFHTQKAAKLFNVDIKDVTPEQRDFSKQFHIVRPYCLSDEAAVALIKNKRIQTCPE